MVGGGLMSLIAYGAQDIYLTGGCGFKIHYKKHIIEDVVVKIEIVGIELINKNNTHTEKIKSLKHSANMFEQKFVSVDCSGIGLKKLPRFKLFENFLTLKYFDCSHNNLKQINKLKYINLIWLNCSNNQLTSIPEKMLELEYLNIAYNRLSIVDLKNYTKLKFLILNNQSLMLNEQSLMLGEQSSSIKQLQIINLPDKLIWLNCSGTNIKNLPDSMSLLEYLDCSGCNCLDKQFDFIGYPKLKYLNLSSCNKNEKISNLPDGLVYLDLSNGTISELPELPDLPIGLEYLLAINTGIKSFDKIFKMKNLKYLDISLNKLYTKLDFLPSRLEYLNCSQCELSELSELNNLPVELKKLICSNNKITKLDGLPDKLVELDCSHNSITELSNLPNGLKRLVCDNNFITELNFLPESLEELNCSSNHIAKLDDLPIGLIKLECYLNNITELSNLPKKLKILKD